MKKSNFMSLFVALSLMPCFSSGVFAQPVEQINAGVINSKAVRLPVPEYSLSVEKLKFSGTVAVEVIIDEQGNVISANAIKSDSKQIIRKFTLNDDKTAVSVEPEPVLPVLAELSEKAALKAKFNPAFHQGIPVKVKGLIVYNFTHPVELGGQKNISSKDAGTYYLSARQFLASGENDKALEELKRAIQLEPEFIEAHRDYQDIQRNKTDSLFQEYDSYTIQNPKSAAFRYLLGRAYSLAGRRDQAEVEYQKALKLDPEYSWALLSAGSIARDRGKISQAVEAWQKARHRAGSGLTLHFLLASNLISVKQYDSALEESLIVLQMAPRFYAAYPLKWRSKINLSSSEKILAEVSEEIRQVESRYPNDIKALEAIQQGYELTIDRAGMSRTRSAISAIDPKYFDRKIYPRIYTFTSTNQTLEFTGPNAQRFTDAKELSDAKQQLNILKDIEREVTDADIKFYLIYPEMFQSYVKAGKFANAEAILKILEEGGMLPSRLASHRIALVRGYFKNKVKLEEGLQQLEKAIMPIRERIDQLTPQKNVQSFIEYEKDMLAQALHVQGLILNAKRLTDEAITSLAASVKEKEAEENTLDLGLLYIKTGRIDEGIKMLIGTYSFEGAQKEKARKILEQVYGKREQIFPLYIVLKEAVNQRRLKLNNMMVSESTDLWAKASARPAPIFELANISGQKISLLDFKGKVVLLNFWATWCEPCIKEWPYLQKIHKERKERDFELVMISVDEEQYRVPLFLKKNFSQAQMLLSDGQVTRIYEERGIPLLVLIDKNGLIRYRKTGLKGQEEEAILQQTIDALLNEQ